MLSIFLTLLSSLIVVFVNQALVFKVASLRLTWKNFVLVYMIWFFIFLVFYSIDYFGNDRSVIILFFRFLNYLLDAFFCFILTLLYLKPVKFYLKVFYTFFPLTFLQIFVRAISYFFPPLLGLEPGYLTGGDGWPIYLHSLIDILSFLLVLGFFKWLRYDFSRFRKVPVDAFERRLIIQTNWVMVAHFLLTQLLGMMLYDYQVDTNSLRILILIFFLVYFLGLINQLDRLMRERLQEKLDFQRSLQLENLAAYSHQVEELYREVRGFRHDYTNLLLSLRLGIENQDMALVEEIYQSVLKDSGKTFRQAKYDIGRLVNLKDVALKSILSSKLLQTAEQGIELGLEIPNEIALQGMDLVDFITILSILYDNALESLPAYINLAYFETANQQTLIVENSIEQESLDIRQIFTFGFSSKGADRGIGLYNVMKLVDSYPNVTLKTSSANYKLTHILEITIQESEE